MKTLSFLALPLLLGMSSGVEAPEYGCNLEKGYCVVSLEAMQQLVHAQRPSCNFYGA